ncbi:hypothetical protein L1887_59846 [Cichorium endivia]|nr:hypothetical protein L1887_59846 [Cichorium endivia]
MARRAAGPSTAPSTAPPTGPSAPASNRSATRLRGGRGQPGKGTTRYAGNSAAEIAKAKEELSAELDMFEDYEEQPGGPAAPTASTPPDPNSSLSSDAAASASGLLDPSGPFGDGEPLWRFLQERWPYGYPDRAIDDIFQRSATALYLRRVARDVHHHYVDLAVDSIMQQFWQAATSTWLASNKQAHATTRSQWEDLRSRYGMAGDESTLLQAGITYGCEVHQRRAELQAAKEAEQAPMKEKLGPEDAHFLCLTSGVDGAEDAVPDTRLLAVVHAGLTVKVVVGVVLYGQLHAEGGQDPTEHRVCPVSPDTAVAEGLDVERVANDEPHLDEVHLGRDGGCEEGDDEDLEHLLVVLCEDGEDGRGMLGCVVLSVDEPEEVVLVAGAVVEVEPVVEGDFPPSDLERGGPREALEDVGHVTAPCEHKRRKRAEDSVDKDALAEVVDVLVVDKVAATVLLVERTVFGHVLVETSDHAHGEPDEGRVVHDPRGCPVHGVVRERVVPRRVQQRCHRGSRQDEHVLLPDRLRGGRATQLLGGVALGVAHVGCDVDGCDELPQRALRCGLQVPCGLGTNTVHLVVAFARDWVGGDRLVTLTTGRVRRGLIARIVGSNRGDVAVRKLLVAHGWAGRWGPTGRLWNVSLCSCHGEDSFYGGFSGRSVRMTWGIYDLRMWLGPCTPPWPPAAGTSSVSRYERSEVVQHVSHLTNGEWRRVGGGDALTSARLAGCEVGLAEAASQFGGLRAQARRCVENRKSDDQTARLR